MKIQLSVIGVIIVLSLMLGSFYFGKSSTRDERDNLNLSLLDAHRKVYEDSVTIAGLKHKTFTQNILIVTSESALKESQEEKERLKVLRVKDIQLIGKLNAKIAVLEKQGHYVYDTINIHDTLDMNKPCPDSAIYKDRWIDIKVGLKNNPIFNVVMDSIPLQITIADKKMGLFKSSPTVSIVDTPNPYVSINRNDIVIIKKPKKWYQTKLFAILTAVGITVAVMK
jgi:hypothetical protein